MARSPLHDRLDELSLAIWRSSDRLVADLRWRIELGLDVALTYPRGPNALPPGTWRSLAQTVGLGLIDQAGAGGPGSRLAGVTLRALEAASAIARRDARLAEKNLETAELELASLGPDDLISSAWDRLDGSGTAPDGRAEVLGLQRAPSEALIRPREAAEA